MRRRYRNFEPSIGAVLIWASYYLVLLIPWMLGRLLVGLFYRPFMSASGRNPAP